MRFLPPEPVVLSADAASSSSSSDSASSSSLPDVKLSEPRIQLESFLIHDQLRAMFGVSGMATSKTLFSSSFAAATSTADYRDPFWSDEETRHAKAKSLQPGDDGFVWYPGAQKHHGQLNSPIQKR